MTDLDDSRRLVVEVNWSIV